MKSQVGLCSAGFRLSTDESCNADLESSRWGKSSPGSLAGDSIGHSCGQQLDAAEDGSKLQHGLLQNRIVKGGVQVQRLDRVPTIHQEWRLLLYGVAGAVSQNSSLKLILFCLQSIAVISDKVDVHTTGSQEPRPPHRIGP